MPPDPSSLSIVLYPDPVLRRCADTIPAVDDGVRAVAERMLELMDQAEGIGLAAPQVALPWRLFVCHVPENEERTASETPPTATHAPLVCINPVLSDPSEHLEPYDEGCLSLPDITGTVRRPAEITLSAIGLDAEPFTLRAGGLLARCIQHEHDHLDGVLIIDRMQQLARIKNRRAIRELEKHTG